MKENRDRENKRVTNPFLRWNRKRQILIEVEVYTNPLNNEFIIPPFTLLLEDAEDSPGVWSANSRRLIKASPFPDGTAFYAPLIRMNPVLWVDLGWC